MENRSLPFARIDFSRKPEPVPRTQVLSYPCRRRSPWPWIARQGTCLSNLNKSISSNDSNWDNRARQGTVCRNPIRGYARKARTEKFELDGDLVPHHPPSYIFSSYIYTSYIYTHTCTYIYIYTHIHIHIHTQLFQTIMLNRLILVEGIALDLALLVQVREVLIIIIIIINHTTRG